MDNNTLELVDYAIRKNLIKEVDRRWAINRIMNAIGSDFISGSAACGKPLESILESLTNIAIERRICSDNPSSRDQFENNLMGILTPAPHEVCDTFYSLFRKSSKSATNWFYKFSQDCNYIRSGRVSRDIKWKYASEYGELDITINLSKPEKDPLAIAAQKNNSNIAYPECQLCSENEGYAGRIGHPSRQNLRLIPITLAGEDWYFQYSPYVYYNEHCIVLNSQHVPMHIGNDTFRRLLEFVTKFPHYFLGSNAELPIVGGSILSHEHYQGGRYTFAMERADIETNYNFSNYPDIKAGILKWPMSVIRLQCNEPTRLAELADRLLCCWRTYTDTSAMIFSETDGLPHNTITPIARRKGDQYELDLVLRNNLVTDEHPLGLYHPHEELHHIKKENIGLIEVMGLAVLPSRLLSELSSVADAIVEGRSLFSDPALVKHAAWAENLCKKYTFTKENIMTILRNEVGSAFCEVLNDAGVYKRNEWGKTCFLRFLDYTNKQLNITRVK
ncbi:MAG: UDP-glucose--hexose-1-phosphate uridylyltransferase [Oscillospiraceae bacterium]|nr:UDP-glucose--hexose-1-phosphate uridylyltransferase [Oscillospiraceae bacterium]